MECPLWRVLILSRSVSKHGHHMQFLFLIGRFLKNLLLWNCLAIWTEASTCMQGSVLSILKAEWKVSDTGSAHWASSLKYDLKRTRVIVVECCFQHILISIVTTRPNRVGKHTQLWLPDLIWGSYTCTAVIK